MHRDVARMIAEQIIDNLIGWSGFGNVWDECELYTQREIIAMIAEIIIEYTK